MKFRNLGSALLSVAGAVGITLGLTSCSADHTVGYVYVLGTSVNGQVGGQINAFHEDNNNGILGNVKGSPTTSGGSNPVRAVIPSGNRFMYVLNAGVANSTDDGTGSLTYTSANIQLFSIGGYGQLSQQIQYASQGFGSTRIAVNSSGTYLFVLDEYAPVGITAGGTASPTGSATASANYPCLGSDGYYHPTGDVSVYAIDGNTGRLALQTNQRQQNLTYFPVGCFPVDFRVTPSYVYTMDAGSATNAYHAGDVETVNVQALGSTGQLTPTQTSSIAIPSAAGSSSVQISAINGDNSGKYIYLIDTINDNLYLYSIASSGALTAIPGTEPYPNSNNTSATGPVQSVVDSTGKYLYVVNGGQASGTNTGNADIGGYSLNATTGYVETINQNSPVNLAVNGTVSGPVCIFEDPTNQYIYVAGSLDNSVTGRKIDPNTGVLSPLNKSYTFPTVGTPSWCLAISSNL